MSWNLAGEQIEKAMQDGEFSNLRGEGKPFNFTDENSVPEEWRLAYRIMKDNDITPEWIGLKKEIEDAIQQARERLNRAYRLYHADEKRLADASGTGGVLKRLEVKQFWRAAQNVFRKEVEEINRKIQIFNLKVPASSLTRDLLNAEREIARLEG